MLFSSKLCLMRCSWGMGGLSVLKDYMNVAQQVSV